MAFQLTVQFLGLCHFIENNLAKNCRMCVVLPQADNHPAEILPGPGTKIIRLSDSKEMTSGILIGGQRVAFDLKPLPAIPKLDFTNGQKGVIELKEIAGNFADDNKEIVEPDPPSAVDTQVLLTRGTFRTTSGSLDWEIPNTLNGSGSSKTRTVDANLFMDVDGLTSAEILIAPLTGGMPEKYALQPTSGTDLAIVVSHDCDNPRPGQTEDEDFMYHYQLLKPENLIAIFKELKKGMKSIPLPKKVDSAKSTVDEGGSNCDCLGSSGFARNFDLDTFQP